MKAKHASQRDHFTSQRILLAAALFVLPLIGHGADDGAWVRKADMPTARMGLSACTLDGIIYAIGGSLLGSGTALATVEAYDPATDLWTTKAAMPNARLYPACAAVNGRIYAMGGELHGIIPVLQNPLSSVHEYDAATDTWTRKADMPSARWGLSAAVVDEKIYALGGYTAYGRTPLSVLEVYDPATDTWESKAAMPTPRGWFSTSVVDGKIFAIGAAQPPSGPWLATVDMYDPLTDTWTPKANMPTARGALASSAVDGLIYAAQAEAATRFSGHFQLSKSTIRSRTPGRSGQACRLRDSILRSANSTGASMPSAALLPPDKESRRSLRWFMNTPRR